MTVRIVAPASAELRETVRWYEMRRTGLGGEFFDAVTATISRIHARPAAGGRPRRRGTHRARRGPPAARPAVWTKAFDTGSDAGVSEENAAKLNRFVHVSDPGSAHGTGRGAVISLPEEIRTNFEGVFDTDQRNAASDRFRCKEFVPDRGQCYSDY